MSYKIMHFREAEEVIRDNNMMDTLMDTIQYLDDVLYGTEQFNELLKQCLNEKGWRDKKSLYILEDRRYAYKGFKEGIAIEGNLSVYEYILQGLFRLQIGYDKDKIDAGVLLLNNIRGDKTPFGSTSELVEVEIELLYPTINLPVSVVLFDLV